MDEMEVRPASPQEDEFALLSLGARSPYESLIIPSVLPEALKLTDPRDLSPDRAKALVRSLSQLSWQEFPCGALANQSSSSLRRTVHG